ncbi:BREX-2 system phosphatase PglZ [Pseudarthrobacter sp. NPDC089323]
MTVEAAITGEVTNAVVRSFVDKARSKNQGKVIAIRAAPNPAARRSFEDHGERVDVVPCVSALAVRVALMEHSGGSWLVILTDRSEDDLGAGILAHFVGNQLRNPDPWEAVRQRFSATNLDRVLVREYGRPEIAQGILRISPDDGWPAAPAGILSADHALGSVARGRLGISGPTIDALSVLHWTAEGVATSSIASLRADAGNELTDAVLKWIARACGAAEAPIRQLLVSGAAAEALPLGLALEPLMHKELNSRPADRIDAEVALARLEHRWKGASPVVNRDGLAALAQVAGTVARRLLSESKSWHQGRRAVGAADALLAELQAERLGAQSDLLPSSFDARFRKLADALRTVPALSAVSVVEDAWRLIESHLLFEAPRDDGKDPRVAPVRGVVRLVRWLTEPDVAAAGLAEMAIRQSAVDAWVDSAYNDAFSGVADVVLAEAIEHILRLVEESRAKHDREFASALASATKQDDGKTGGFISAGPERVWYLESLLSKVVLPLASTSPLLLIILDGMSTVTAAELVQTIVAGHEGWNEVIPKAVDRRVTALAVLPTLTEHSRTSLLCGRLTSGGQKQEQDGFASLAHAYTSVLHHKKILDTSRPGFVLHDEVRHDITEMAIDGTPHKQVVACVLNTIDDALDRSDPAGTSWNQDAVKHLRPLLAAALAAGRTVVLTADHGHIVERRKGTQRSYPDISSARSRSASVPAGEEEVLVEGTRVLAHTGRAVLAVDETLRYGPLKAGYHGGAAPAEVVVPVAVLVPSTRAEAPPAWKFAGPQEPLWWSASPTMQVPTAAVPTGTKPTKAPTLFDEFEAEKPLGSGLGASVIASKTYKDQVKLAGRVTVDNDTIGLFIDALATASGSRMQMPTAAVVIRVPLARMRGAVAQLQKLLNVEGYAVLRSDGSELVLDVPLLREQFGLGT